jgi:hypothetical protein
LVPFADLLVIHELGHAFHDGVPFLFPRSWLMELRLTMMAKGLIDTAGPNMLRRLWDAFALSDKQLTSVLGGRVHPAAGHWLAS